MHDEFDEGNWTAGFRSKRTWIRGFFMLVFLFILWFARLLLIVMTVFQFGAQLIIRRPVARGLPLGRSLAAYLQQIAMFLTYNSEDKPFPFAPWPDPGPGAEENGEEGEPWEEYEPYPPAAEPEPEEEPEAEEEPKPKPAKSASKGGRKKKAAKAEAAADEETAEDVTGDDEPAAPDDDENEDEPTPPRPDA